MAPVIFGLPFSEFTWSKFGNANMWNNVYHLRRTKFIVYQLAMIFCVVSESLGTDALSRFVSQQKYIESHGGPGASEYNNDYVGVASYNIFAGIYVATIFGGAFFFDLIWPERHEDHGVRLGWKLSAIAGIFIHLASCIAMTVIVATRSAYVIGLSAADGNRLVMENGKTPLVYRHSARIVTSVVFGWIGWIFVIASTVILVVGKSHDEKVGPWSTHVREAKKNNIDVESNFVSGQPSEKPLTNPLTGEQPEALRPNRPEAAHVHEPTPVQEASVEASNHHSFDSSAPPVNPAHV
ncbi:hypothetical protein E4T49_00705 [Aureobasidium sp. EXF-10728]|nr:hypothetical protein E4T49_00705 [Aureobasidium sp. EXF-10728]